MQDDKHTEGFDPVEIPIDGTLDLHAFNPRDLKQLLPDYLDACREKQILQVRVIHGKGSGFLKKSVLSILSRLSSVASFKPAGEDAGGWGATIVTLKPPEKVNSVARAKPQSTQSFRTYFFFVPFMLSQHIVVLLFLSLSL
jgi:hypothetical protein